MQQVILKQIGVFAVLISTCQEIVKLTEHSKTQPHAAYAIFCRGVLHKYTYLMRTIQDIDEHLKTLNDIISNTFLQTFLDSIVTDNEQSPTAGATWWIKNAYFVENSQWTLWKLKQNYWSTRSKYNFAMRYTTWR